MNTKQFQNRNIVIFGASGTIGSAIANLFHNLEANLVLVKHYSEVPHCGRDEVMTMQQVEAYEGADAVICCAGSADHKPIISCTQLDLIDIPNQLNVARVAVQIAACSTSPRCVPVVLFSSQTARKSYPSTFVYAATKASMEVLARIASVELAPNVRVNVVAPGIVESPLARYALKEDYEKIAAMTPLRRAVSVSEVANTVLWLCSDESSAVTGQVIPVDAGGSLK